MQIGWVDFSKEDRQKTLEVINLLSQKEKSTVDELGIGVVRDAFANCFFPGTSTIQTRAKYFLIVSYLLKEAGSGRYGDNLDIVLSTVNAQEKQCGIRLLQNSRDKEGIIGKRVLPGGFVARKPSDIYWNGIRTYKLFTENSLSIMEYLSLSIKLRQQKEMHSKSYRKKSYASESEEVSRDDEDAGDEMRFSFWNLAPVYKENWRKDLQISLSKEEADFLKSQIEKSVPDTLLAYLLRNHIDLDRYSSFAALTEEIKTKVDSSLSSLMDLACDFNRLIYMARVRYNILYFQGKNSEANEEWAWIEPNCRIWAEVDLKTIFKQLQLKHPKLFSFLTSLQKCFRCADTDSADALIRNWEIQLKGKSRAKLKQPGKYDADNPIWIGGRWLDYRLFDARRIISDIYQGEYS